MTSHICISETTHTKFNTHRAQCQTDKRNAVLRCVMTKEYEVYGNDEYEWRSGKKDHQRIWWWRSGRITIENLLNVVRNMETFKSRTEISK